MDAAPPTPAAESAPEASPQASPQAWHRPVLACYGALLAVLVIDLASKHVLVPPGPHIGPAPTGWLAIEPAFNPGVAWGMFGRWPGAITILTWLLLPVLVWAWWRWYRPLGWWVNLACGAIMGGALGNAYDRTLTSLGHGSGVRDFIRVDLAVIGIDYVWPTFNVADMGISVGFVLLLTLSFIGGQQTKSR